MNTPPLLLGLSLLFWGWQSGFLAAGAILGVLIELPRLSRARWVFSQADYDRLWNLCAAVFLAAAAYLFFSQGSLSFNDFLVDAGRRPEAIREKGQAALRWFQWFPMLFFPFAIAVAWSENAQIEVSTFSWFLRRSRKSNAGRDVLRVNIAFPYLAVILFASAASSQRNPWFYPCFCLLLGWALWSRRTRRYPGAAWGVLFGLVIIAGNYSHRGMARLERALEEMNVTWFSRFAMMNLDTKQTRTAIGSIGRVKLSDRITLRIRTDGQPPPPLLREASYSLYREPLWLNPHKEFTRVISEATNNSTWLLLPDSKPRRTVNVARYVQRGTGILPVPNGTTVLDRLGVEETEFSALGVVRVKGAPGLIAYDAHYEDRKSVDSDPTWDDMRSFDNEEPAIAEVAAQLGLHPGMAPQRAMALVQGYFTANFQYSTYLPGRYKTNETALSRFLLKDHSGHCEYFATATTLLLRKAGVPTRYAIGYSIQEGSGRKYVVRERHAHSWALVHDGVAWRDFDTTPPSWNAAETPKSWMRPLRDLFSEAWFLFSKWRWASTDWRSYLIWLAVPILTAALAMFFLKKQWRRIHRKDERPRHSRRWPGLDSEFYTVERALAARGFNRNEGETLHRWLVRIDGHVRPQEALRDLAALHTKYRFDPQGLSEEERSVLRERSATVVRELKRTLRR